MTTTIFCPFSINSQSRQTDSNRRPADYKSAALPTELCRHFPRKIAVNLSSASAFLYCTHAVFIAQLDKVLDVIVCAGQPLMRCIHNQIGERWSRFNRGCTNGIHTAHAPCVFFFAFEKCETA